jgi:hypothetical protein
VRIKTLRILNRKIAKIAGITVSINIYFPDDRTSINIYSPDNQHISMYIDYPVYLSIELPRIGYETDNKYRRFNITPYTQETLIDTMYEFLDIFKKDDIFYLDGGKLFMYAPVKEEYRKRVRLNDTWLMFSPVIVLDVDQNQYEGVEITLNREGNTAMLTYSEFKSLAKTINKADIFLYSQLLLNFIGRNTIFRSEDERKRLEEQHAALDKRIDSLDFSSKANETQIANHLSYQEKEKERRRKRNELSQEYSRIERENKRDAAGD